MEVHPGRVSALVGDNGAGKSTLIKGSCGRPSPTTRATSSSTGSRSRCTHRRTPRRSGSRSSIRTSPCARTWTSSRTCSSGARRSTTGLLNGPEIGAARGDDARVAVGADDHVRAPEGLLAVGRAAPDGRDRSLGAAEGPRRDPRRATAALGVVADRAGSTARAAARRLRCGRADHQSQPRRRVRGGRSHPRPLSGPDGRQPGRESRRTATRSSATSRGPGSGISSWRRRRCDDRGRNSAGRRAADRQQGTRARSTISSSRTSSACAAATWACCPHSRACSC